MRAIVVSLNRYYDPSAILDSLSGVSALNGRRFGVLDVVPFAEEDEFLPYWAELWPAGLALAHALPQELAGRRVVELGCGLGVPSLVAARDGATVLATDACGEALELLQQNARENGLAVETARIDWEAADELVACGPFDLALAADVLYERSSVAPLLSLLPRLADQAWLADPGRPAAGAFLDQARQRWRVTTTVRDGVEIHRLARAPPR